MKLISIPLLLFFSLCVFGQDYSKVEQIIKSYPSSFNNVKELSDKIDYDFKLQHEKVRALYYWLALNIDYNSRKDNFSIGDNIIMYSSQREKERELRLLKKKRLNNILKYKKAICIDYSEIFKSACDNMGIESEVVTGYSRIYIDDIENEKKYKNHAWNAVKINNKWQLVDITWASAFIKGLPTNITRNFYDYYYFTNPEELILTHFPSDSKWQLLTHKVSKSEFFKKPLFYPNYFQTSIKLTDPYKGVINVTKKRVQIYFDEIPKDGEISYSMKGDNQVAPLLLKQTKDGKYIGSIKYRNTQNTQLILYTGYLPVLGFKINPTLAK